MISIVLPIFDESENIAALYDRLHRAAGSWGEPYEIVLVDDGSHDDSFQQLAALHRRDPRWKVLSLSRNFGHQTAISAGLAHTTGDVVAIMDADLQDPPEELGRFLAKWREGYDVVYAIRTKRKEAAWKRLAYASYYRILRQVASIDIPLDSGDFCVMDRRVVEVLRQCPERTRFVRGLRSWSGFRQIGIPFERHARHAGEVKYTLWKLMRLAADGVFSFSVAPLRLASWLGMALCVAAFALTALLIAWWASDVAILGMRPAQAVGWTSLLSAMLMLSGTQMLLLGFIGEYLARVFDEVRGRPPWVVGSALGFDEAMLEARSGWFGASGRETAVPARKSA